jgi:hypothetical protein
LLHPDVNKSPRAHEEFLALYEAFARLVSEDRSAAINYKSTSSRAQFYAEAQKAARMKYNEWIRSEEYKKLMEVTTVGNFFMTLFLLSVVLFLPLVAGWKIGGGLPGVIIGLLIGVVIAFFLTRERVLGQYLQPQKAFNVVFRHTKLSSFITFVLFVVNVVVFFRVGLFTLIYLPMLLALYVASFLIICFVVKPKTNKLLDVYRRSSFSATIISILLCLNFFVSNDTQSVTYYFDRKVQEDTLLEFNHDELKDYSGVRFFFFIDEEHGKPIGVEYLFKKGLLGYPVVENYKFVKLLP